MSTPILATKLYIPQPRPNVVSRPRLIERLNEGLHRTLTLVSAPAGFGKTTLISAWVKGIERPAAWLSLDDGENDPARFLAYLVAALQTVAPTLGDGVLRALHAPQPSPPGSRSTRLPTVRSSRCITPIRSFHPTTTLRIRGHPTPTRD